MINLFTRRDKLAEVYPEYTLIKSTDNYFLETLSLDDLDEIDSKTMEIIDHIKVETSSFGVSRLKSPFGTVLVQDFSTGCKTAIILNHIIKEKRKDIVNLTQAGNNAIYRCFELLGDSMVPVLLQHGGLGNEFSNLTYRLNGGKIAKGLVYVNSACSDGDGRNGE